MINRVIAVARALWISAPPARSKGASFFEGGMRGERGLFEEWCALRSRMFVRCLRCLRTTALSSERYKLKKTHSAGTCRSGRQCPTPTPQERRRWNFKPPKAPSTRKQSKRKNGSEVANVPTNEIDPTTRDSTSLFCWEPFGHDVKVKALMVGQFR
jgi:hypothetical protein